MKIDDEHDLRERLAAVFEATSPHPAPVDDAIRGGRVIKRRRRMALAVGAGVVAVAGAVAVPSLVRQSASPAPAAPVKSYTVTVRPPGPGAPPGLISSGTVNGQPWSISADRPGADPGRPGQQDIVVTGPGTGTLGGTDLSVPALGTQAGPGPVSLIGSTFGKAVQVQVGAVQADVSYVTVRLGNGTVLALYPVSVYGTRAVAFVMPVRATITEVAVYSRHGELAFSVPFNWPGGMAWVISWLQPGQVTAPRVSGVVGSGQVHGKAWSATAYLGPWGACVGLTSAGAPPGGLCVQDLHAGAAVATLDPGSTPEVAGGLAPSSVTRVVVTQPDGTKVQVRLVTVGGEKAFAVALRPGGKQLSWVAYDSAGKVVASSPSSSAR